MALSEAQIVTRIQRELRDASTAVYATADIHMTLAEALSDVAEYVPEINLATVTTSEGTKSINIGGLTNLLYGEHEMSFAAVEFPVNEDPVKLRNFSVMGSVMHLGIDFLPGASEDVRLYLKRPHDLYGSTSTLDHRLERIIIPLVAGKVVLNHTVDKLDAVNVGGPRTVADFLTVGHDKVNRAMRDLKSIKHSSMAVEYPRSR